MGDLLRRFPTARICPITGLYAVACKCGNFCRHLRLQLPIANDYNDPECVIFHKVWWGRRNPDTDIEFRGLTASEITKYVLFFCFHLLKLCSAAQHLEESKRNLYVGNLPPTDDESRPALEEFLWELFTPFEAETIVLREGKTHAFVKVCANIF